MRTKKGSKIMIVVGVVFIIIALLALNDSQVIQNSLLVVGGGMATIGGINLKKSKTL